MARVAVFRPKSLKNALATVAKTAPPHYFLAGGTDLLVAAKDGTIPDSTWLDLTAVKELAAVKDQGESILLGSGVTFDAITRSRLLKKYAPALVEGAMVIGGPQIRARGTVGGNLSNASPAADTVPPFFSLGAEVEIANGAGRRWVPIQEFFLGPRKSVLADGEIITAVRFPKREGMRGTFLRLGQRQAQAISKVSVAISAILTGSRFQYIGIALGSVAPTVLRAPKTEAILRESGLAPAGIEAACRQIQEEIAPITDLRSNKEYRKAMAGVLLHKSLQRIAQR